MNEFESKRLSSNAISLSSDSESDNALNGELNKAARNKRANDEAAQVEQWERGAQ